MKINSCEITDFIIDSLSALGKIYAPNHAPQLSESMEDLWGFKNKNP
jgi:hypothetical protein